MDSGASRSPQASVLAVCRFEAQPFNVFPRSQAQGCFAGAITRGFEVGGLVGAGTTGASVGRGEGAVTPRKSRPGSQK